MNAERLHAIAVALHKEMVATQTVAQIEALCNSLQQVLQQNNHPQFQENLANNLKKIYSSLSVCPSENFSPAWKQLLSEMGGTSFFGLSLKASVEEVFQRNQITPAVALKELQQLSQRLNAFQQALDQILAAFKQFKIGNEKLEPGECEIGMLIPRDAVGNNRIDRGYNIEVKVEPVKATAQDSEEVKKTAELIETIQAASKNMQFMKLEGKPILKLPENVDKQKAKKE